MSSHDQDLFQPSLQGQAQPLPAEGLRPWRLWSPFWIAFFGGVLPYAVVAYRNSRRLGLPPERQRLLLALCGVGLLATVLVTYGLSVWLGSDRSGVVRIGSRFVAIVVFLAGYALQKSADRRYNFTAGASYASLWGFGIAVTFGLGLLQNLLVYGLIRLLP